MKEHRLPFRGSAWHRGADVRVLRARLMGLWAARQFGLEGMPADRYVSELISADQQLGRHAIMAKILRDAARQDVGLKADEVWTELRLCEWEARRQIDRSQPTNGSGWS